MPRLLVYISSLFNHFFFFCLQMLKINMAKSRRKVLSHATANNLTIYNTILASVTFWKQSNIRIARHGRSHWMCGLPITVVGCDLCSITELTKQWHNVKRRAQWFPSKTTSFRFFLAIIHFAPHHDHTIIIIIIIINSFWLILFWCQAFQEKSAAKKAADATQFRHSAVVAKYIYVSIFLLHQKQKVSRNPIKCSFIHYSG